MPVYNSAGTLARAVQSVLDQTMPSFELLIVDDGSTDESAAVAAELTARDRRIRFIALGENGGKARAMNLAAEQALGRWIAVLDADDRYLPDRLSRMVHAGECRNVQMVADNQHHLDGANGTLFRLAFNAVGEGREVGLADFIAHADPAATFDFGILKPLVRADFLRAHQISYHPEARLAEDFYFMLDCFACGARAWMLHAPLYEWTLPFSPSARRWTETGAGAWRYDYRNALAINGDFEQKYAADRPALQRLLRWRGRQYRTMIHYLDAQRAVAEHRDWKAALHVIVTHPTTWTLLIKRAICRIGRSLTRMPSSNRGT